MRTLRFRIRAGTNQELEAESACRFQPNGNQFKETLQESNPGEVKSGVTNPFSRTLAVMKRLEVTLAILKPDLFMRKKAKEVSSILSVCALLYSWTVL